jgi:YidC/Oxa1 family membrane protein insertase
VLNFLYTAVSWVLLQWHHLFNLIGLDPNGGLNWALSIVFLVVTARLLLFRLFIKQVKYQRHMQTMQPKIQALRKKYKGDKGEMQRQMMALQQEQGFNPLSGCLPMFLQFPIFIGLYHVLRHLANSVNRPSTDPRNALYSFTPAETLSAAKSKLFGAPLAGRLTDSPAQIKILGGERSVTIAVILVLVLISASATFVTQRLVRAGNPIQPEGNAALIQKAMLYLIPVGTLGSGLFFPLGVLLYWFTSNSWTMGQQFYVNKFHPHEGTLPSTAGALGKTLAPKPGQRPIRLAKSGPSLTREPPSGTSATADGAGSSVTARGNTPRPGQRPKRPQGSHPPAKRPSQAKKRR